MTNTTKRAAMTVSDVAGCVEATLFSLAENDGGLLSSVDVDVLKSAARSVAAAACDLKLALRAATELLEENGVELPDFPRFSY